MPLRRAAVLLGTLVLLAACGASRSSSGSNPRGGGEAALLDVWLGLDAGFADIAGRESEVCDVVFGTWFADFGVRGLACAAAAARPPDALVAEAGVAPFTSGPHAATATAVQFDLTDERDFGRYDPAFVRWVVANGIPDAEDAAVRALTQPVYDRRLRRLVRLYWLTHADMAADGFPEQAPAGILADYAAFLDGGPIPAGAEGYEGGFSVFAFTDLSEGLLPRVGAGAANEWEVKYEANTAYGFWLRRRADGTAALWHDGLRRLLALYDADWLAANA